MNWKLFIARRIYKQQEGSRQVSRPAVRIATIGIAIGLAVMLVTVSVVLGFKQETRSKVVGLGADILVTSIDVDESFQTTPVSVTDSMLSAWRSIEGVTAVQRYSTKPGMIMTENDFQGMVLKGVGQEYDNTFLQAHLLEGEIPQFTDSVSTNKVLISHAMSVKLGIGLGDKLYTYYIEDNIRARRLEVAGIYQTNFSMYDDMFLITDLYTVNRLNGWKGNLASGAELFVARGYDSAPACDVLREAVLPLKDESGRSYLVRPIEEVHPQIFAWLDLLDLNVWVILVLMTGVAGFTMVSGLLIIILERTNMIGVLKALGSSNLAIRKIFLGFSVFLIGKGMLWGNVIGLLLIGVQYFFRVIKLDPTTYYVNAVPVVFDFWLFVLLNIGTLIVSILMLVAPSYLVSRIHPAKSIRFE